MSAIINKPVLDFLDAKRIMRDENLKGQLEAARKAYLSESRKYVDLEKRNEHLQYVIVRNNIVATIVCMAAFFAGYLVRVVL